MSVQFWRGRKASTVTEPRPDAFDPNLVVTNSTIRLTEQELERQFAHLDASDDPDYWRDFITYIKIRLYSAETATLEPLLDRHYEIVALLASTPLWRFRRRAELDAILTDFERRELEIMHLILTIRIRLTCRVWDRAGVIFFEENGDAHT